MRTQTITIYTFDELPDETKSKVRDNFRNSGDLWHWQTEHWDSGQAFARIAPIDIIQADFGCGHVDTRWTGDDAIGDLSGLRAWKWLLNNDWFKWASDMVAGSCTMTGYCADCFFGDAIAEYERNPMGTPELRQVFYEACQAWAQGGRADCEYVYSDNAIDETIEANEYEFYASGALA